MNKQIDVCVYVYIYIYEWRNKQFDKSTILNNVQVAEYTK